MELLLQALDELEDYWTVLAHVVRRHWPVFLLVPRGAGRSEERTRRPRRGHPMPPRPVVPARAPRKRPDRDRAAPALGA